MILLHLLLNNHIYVVTSSYILSHHRHRTAIQSIQLQMIINIARLHRMISNEGAILIVNLSPFVHSIQERTVL